MNIQVSFWVLIPHTDVVGYQHFKWLCCLHLHRNAEDQNLNLQCCENLKFHTHKNVFTHSLPSMKRNMRGENCHMTWNNIDSNIYTHLIQLDTYNILLYTWKYSSYVLIPFYAQEKLSDSFRQASAKIGATIGLRVNEEDGTITPVPPVQIEMPEVHSPISKSQSTWTADILCEQGSICNMGMNIPWFLTYKH
jgi:hypothetical protein